MSAWRPCGEPARPGMRHIERDLIPLAPPDEAELGRAYRTLRNLHGGAFGWEPPDVPGDYEELAELDDSTS